MFIRTRTFTFDCIFNIYFIAGTDAGEEEVDIGDDMPAKEFPPVVIEKDKGANTKNSSSSSSSSGSGSSSSGNSRLNFLFPQ